MTDRIDRNSASTVTGVITLKYVEVQVKRILNSKCNKAGMYQTLALADIRLRVAKIQLEPNSGQISVKFSDAIESHDTRIFFTVLVSNNVH